MEKPVWILTTPRTGSTLLAGYLTDGLGLEPGLTERYIINPEFAHLRVPEGTIPAFNKVFPHQYRQFWGDLNLSRVEKEHPGIRWIFLYRKGKWAQAESHVKAMATGVWNARPDELPAPEHESSEVEVEQARRMLRREELLWWERLRERAHVSLCYESLTDYPAATLSRLFGWLGRPDVDVTALKPRTVKIERG